MYLFKQLFFITVILMMNYGISHAQKKNNIGRTKENFGFDWSFKREETKDEKQEQWEKINLPHTAKIEALVVNHQWQGKAIYQKKFTLKKEDKKYFLYFEGVMHEAKVEINHKLLAHHEGGYLPFMIDITNDVFSNKENQIVVNISNEDNSHIPPGKPLNDLDFNYYGGMYRNVYLITTNKLHMTNAVYENKPASGGAMIWFDNVAQEKATAHINVHIKNEYKVKKTFDVDVTLSCQTQNLIHRIEKISIPAGADKNVQATFEIKNPILWSVNNPNLHTATIAIVSQKEIVDEIEEMVGIRKMEIKKDGFYLNDQRIFISGTNRHQEYPYIGYALSDEAQYRDAVKIKNAGFNFVRLSHYPQAEAFMNACDELGILVLPSIPGWQFFGEKEFVENSLQDCRDLIRRDRNHPSIIFWELSLNESAMSEEYMKKATLILKEELPYPSYSAGWMDNSVYDVFIPARQHASFPNYWKNYQEGKRPFFISEYGDWEYYAQNAGFNQTEFKNLKEEERTSRQLRNYGEKRLLQQVTNFQESSNDNMKSIGRGLLGQANWLMFDYNRGYANDIESSGISDIFRIQKFAYFFYQSQTPINIKPQLKILSYWDEMSSTQIKVCSNCEEVELRLNDSLIGRKKITRNEISSHLEHPPFLFDLQKFQKGTLHAIGYVHGEKVIADEVLTHSIPHKIKLFVDYSGKEISITHPDVVFVYAMVVDERNIIVPTSTIPIQFSVEGEGVLIGENPISAEAGIATILLRTEKSPIQFTIKATGKNLLSDELIIK